MIKQASMLIDSLQKELLKAHAETKSAEDRETVLRLKLEQETEMLQKAQETLNVAAKDRAGRAREAFGRAENTFDMQRIHSTIRPSPQPLEEKIEIEIMFSHCKA